MFLDETKIVETKPDVFKLETLIAWLEKQPADRVYNYCNPHGCLLCQYFTANGYPNCSVAPRQLHPNGRLGGYEVIYFSDDFERVAVGDLYRRNRTFGGSLKIAKRLAGQGGFVNYLRSFFK